MNLLKERAEDYTSDELEKLWSVNSRLLRNLEGYLFSSLGEGRPCTFLGAKGSGKTFHLIKALRRGVRELEEFSPVMFVYEKEGKLETLDPSLLVPSESESTRLSEFAGLGESEALEKASTIVFDDFHYLCEAVERGEYPPTSLVEFLEKVLVQVDQGKRVVISSANQLSAYSDAIDHPRFDQILPMYGFGEDLDKDAVAQLQVTLPPLSEWKSIAQSLRIQTDNVVLEFLHDCDANPRKLVKFAKLFEGRVTRPKLRQVGVERMKRFTGERCTFEPGFFDTLFELPSLSPHFHSLLGDEKEKHSSKEVLDRLKTRKKKIRSLAGKIAEDLKLPELKEVNEEEWAKDPVYAMSAKYRSGPLGKRVVEGRVREATEDEKIEEHFLTFIQNPERYRTFLEDLNELKEKLGKHFSRILENFDSLFDRVGSEWFPVAPCKIAFRDILYGDPATEESLEFLTSFSSSYDSPPPAHEIIDRLAPRLTLPENVRARSHEIFEKSRSKGMLKGRTTEVVALASVYMACRQNNLSRSLGELAKRALNFGPIGQGRLEGISKKEMESRVFSIYKRIRDELDIEVSAPGPSGHVARIGRILELSPETLEEAEKIVEGARDENIVSGRSPEGVAAGAVYLSSAMSNEEVTQREVADVAGVTEITVRTRYKELKEKLDLALEG